jgi:predicted CXXCH cytochrome family protein
MLDDLEDLYEPVRFDHRIHADMAAISVGCEACHHRTPQGAEHAACRNCHEVSPARTEIGMPGLKGAYHRQCTNCHREWSGNTSCQVCHLPKQRPGIPAKIDLPSGHEAVGGRAAPAARPGTVYVYRTSHSPRPVVTFHHIQHVETYGQRCVDCHRGDPCGRCHNDSAARTGVQHLKSCCSCHQEKNCNFCHDEKERPSFDHATSAGWPLEPHHTDVACSACHGMVETFTSPSRECRFCHEHWQAGRFDHRVLGASVDCGECHAEVALAGPATRCSHKPIEDGCVACHHPHATDTACRLRQAVPDLCFSCHEDMKEHFDAAPVVHGAATGAAACTACHRPHYSLLPRLVNRTQADLCLSCHNRQIPTGDDRPLMNIAGLLRSGSNHHGPVREGECLACHRPHAGEHFRLLNEEFPPGLYAPFDFERYELCFGCHEEELVADESGTGVTGFRDGDRNLHWLHVNRAKGRTCRACHDVHASSLPHHIRERPPRGAGGGALWIKYEATADGGSCAPLCHKALRYRRSTTSQPSL